MEETPHPDGPSVGDEAELYLLGRELSGPDDGVKPLDMRSIRQRAAQGDADGTNLPDEPDDHRQPYERH